MHLLKHSCEAHLHLVKHALLVEVKVAARLPQVDLGHVWGVHELVALLHVQVLPEGFNLVADHRSVPVPKHQAATCGRLDGRCVAR